MYSFVKKQSMTNEIVMKLKKYKKCHYMKVTWIEEIVETFIQKDIFFSVNLRAKAELPI